MKSKSNGSKANGGARSSKAKLYEVEIVSIDSLKEHPKNYREHPDDQLEHLVNSLKRFGVYRNVVAAKDGTILAGHGVVKAAKQAGLKDVPIIRLKVGPNDPGALKVLIGDNEIEHLAEQNDRLLSELLKQVKDLDVDGLVGTGFDDMMLANFAMVTRPESEIEDFDAAAQWVGMPEFNPGEKRLQLLLSFKNEEERKRCCELLKLPTDSMYKRKYLWTSWWPWEGFSDRKSVKFKG